MSYVANFPASKIPARQNEGALEPTPLVVIADVSHFGAPITIDHDGEFVQVTIAPNRGAARTYCKRISYGGNEDRCSHIADEVEKVAALVGWPSLVAWLLDCGFVLTH